MITKGKSDGEKRVGIWIRVSTEDQVRGESPEHHERRARAYAESRDWTVVEVYRLDAVSGKSVMDRPETQLMLEHIRTGHIQGLIFSKLARLARNTRELLEFSEIFQSCGTDLISLQESIDTSTPAGRLFYTMIAAMAQWEREEIADRVAASVPIRAKMGKNVGGKAPYGYRWEGNRLIPHPQEAPVRKMIYDLFLEHKRKKTVARILNEAGYRTSSGALFSDTAIKRAITDPTAKGVHRANYTKTLKDGQVALKPEEEWVWQESDPIVSEEIWNAANHLLNEQQRTKIAPGKRPSHLFAGLVVCQCGQKMYVPSNSTKYTCQACRTKIPADDLEFVFQDQIKDYFLSPEDVVQHLANGDQVLQEKEEILKVLGREEEKLRAEMDKVYHLYLKDRITGEGFGAKYRPMEERLAQLEDEIPRLEAECDYIRISHLSEEQILEEARNLSAQWPHMEFDEKRRLVEAITESIKIGENSVEINLFYLPALKNTANRQQIAIGL
ncbi:MAG: hypothetical protein GHCLOJNM_03293 [bacterium]|nr:hypothetical protein [bacterium]